MRISYFIILSPYPLQASCIFKQGQWGTVPASINNPDVASLLRMTTDTIRTSRIFLFFIILFYFYFFIMVFFPG